jgi:hypothetical protein
MRSSAVGRGTRRLNLVGFGLAVLGVLLLIGLLPDLGNLLATKPLSDVRAYYDAGARLNAGQPLYPASADVNVSEYYRYPPLLAIAFRPLALLPYHVAALLWELLMVASLILAVRLLAPPRATVWALGILAFPIAWCLAIGQAQVLVTWLLALATPWSVALAGQLKILPALAAVYWVGRHDWRALRQFVLWTVALIVVQVVLEPRGSFDFLSIANLGQVGNINNLSPYGVSPILWAILFVLGGMASYLLARGRYGWATAVAFSVLATPRLISYLLMALLAGLSREPARHERLAGEAAMPRAVPAAVPPTPTPRDATRVSEPDAG